MNVLLFFHNDAAAYDDCYFWKSHLTHKDNLLIVNLGKSNMKQICGYDVHRFELNFSKSSCLYPILYRALEQKVGLFWNIIIWRFWSDFLWNIWSSDPDIIDLRCLPNSQKLKAKLASELPQIHVLSEVDAPSLESICSSWRCYDHNIKVSIVLPVYNGAQYLSQSIESCLHQTHQNIELVIVDDCSTDKTPDIISKYARQDSRIIDIRNDHNLRLPGALNVGFAKTTGELLTWTSHDNYYAPNAIETLVRYLSTYKDIDFVYSAYQIIERDRIASDVNYLPPPWELPFWNTVGAYFLYRRIVYDDVGEFRDDMEYLEDYEYWVRVYKKGFKMMRLHLPFYYYRHHSNSMTARARNMNDKLWDKVQYEHFNHKRSRKSLFSKGIK